MRKKKNPFLTFCFACIPGAGQMFLGFFKQGVSLMSTFIVVALLSSMFYDIPIYLFDFVIWFYAFFDAINKNAMTEEEFAAQEDKFMFVDGLDALPKLNAGKRRKGLAAVLICLGAYLLCNDVLSILTRFDIWIPYAVNEMIRRDLPQLIVACLVIWFGIRLIRGKKEDLTEDERKYLEGRDEK